MGEAHVWVRSHSICPLTDFTSSDALRVHPCCHQWLTEKLYEPDPLPWLHTGSPLSPVGFGPRAGAEDAVAHVREPFPRMNPPVPLGLPQHSGCFHVLLLRAVLQWTRGRGTPSPCGMGMCTSLRYWLHFLWINTQEWTCWIYVSSIFKSWEASILFFIVSSPIYVPIYSDQGRPSLFVLTNICYFVSFWWWAFWCWYLSVVFICISLLISDVQHLFTCLPSVCLF